MHMQWKEDRSEWTDSNALHKRRTASASSELLVSVSSLAVLISTAGHVVRALPASSYNVMMTFASYQRSQLLREKDEKIFDHMKLA